MERSGDWRRTTGERARPRIHESRDEGRGMQRERSKYLIFGQSLSSEPYLTPKTLMYAVKGAYAIEGPLIDLLHSQKHAQKFDSNA